jgi:hypothetical protein
LNFGSKEVVHFINKSWTNRIKKLYNTRWTYY